MWMYYFYQWVDMWPVTRCLQFVMTKLFVSLLTFHILLEKRCLTDIFTCIVSIFQWPYLHLLLFNRNEQKQSEIKLKLCNHLLSQTSFDMKVSLISYSFYELLLVLPRLWGVGAKAICNNNWYAFLVLQTCAKVQALFSELKNEEQQYKVQVSLAAYCLKSSSPEAKVFLT